jgi:hypothetical protein
VTACSLRRSESSARDCLVQRLHVKQHADQSEGANPAEMEFEASGHRVRSLCGTAKLLSPRHEHNTR